MPDATEPFAALEDRHVVIAGAAQHHRGAHAAEAAADHHDRAFRAHG